MDPQKPEDGKTSQGEERAEKPLGRGLEQISHLFLTQRLNNLRADDPSFSRAGDSAVSEMPSRTESRSVLLKPDVSLTKHRLVALLREFQNALEDGLRVIDVLLPCHPYGEIDLLALDRSNQLTIIDFDTTLGEGLVVRGLAHCEWLVHNLPNVRRMHSGQRLQLSTPPRLFLLVPRFSSFIMSAARQLIQPQVTWIRYQVLDTGATTGILFERLETE
jgi:hypothetical protein